MGAQLVGRRTRCNREKRHLCHHCRLSTRGRLLLRAFVFHRGSRDCGQFAEEIEVGMTRLACGFRVTFLKLSVDASRSRGLEQGAKLSSPRMIHIVPTAVVHSGATPITRSITILYLEFRDRRSTTIEGRKRQLRA